MQNVCIKLTKKKIAAVLTITGLFMAMFFVAYTMWVNNTPHVTGAMDSMRTNMSINRLESVCGKDTYALLFSSRAEENRGCEALTNDDISIEHQLLEEEKWRINI